MFSLALICHEASSAVLANQKKVHLATTSAPGATTHLFRKLLLSSNGIRFSFETLVSYYLWALLCMQRCSFQEPWYVPEQINEIQQKQKRAKQTKKRCIVNKVLFLSLRNASLVVILGGWSTFSLLPRISGSGVQPLLCPGPSCAPVRCYPDEELQVQLVQGVGSDQTHR